MGGGTFIVNQRERIVRSYIRKHYDEWLTAAEKVHIWFLRLVTSLLTMDLWLLSLSGIGSVYLFLTGGLTVFGGVILVLFLICYGLSLIHI